MTKAMIENIVREREGVAKAIGDNLAIRLSLLNSKKDCEHAAEMAFVIGSISMAEICGYKVQVENEAGVFTSVSVDGEIFKIMGVKDND